MFKIERYPSGELKSLRADIPLMYNSALDITAAFYIAVLLLVLRAGGIM